jgi:hypothetical protein
VDTFTAGASNCECHELDTAPCGVQGQGARIVTGTTEFCEGATVHQRDSNPLPQGHGQPTTHTHISALTSPVPKVTREVLWSLLSLQSVPDVRRATSTFQSCSSPQRTDSVAAARVKSVEHDDANSIILRTRQKYCECQMRRYKTENRRWYCAPRRPVSCDQSCARVQTPLNLSLQRTREAPTGRRMAQCHVRVKQQAPRSPRCVTSPPVPRPYININTFGARARQPQVRSITPSEEHGCREQCLQPGVREYISSGMENWKNIYCI